MAEMASNRSMSILDASQHVARMFPEACASCRNKKDDSTSCDSLYLRYDDVAPRIDRAVTHSLSSIPTDQHRLPPTAFRDLDEYFSDQGNQYKDYWFEYNPSIVRLPPSYIEPPLPFGETPIYLASYRVSKHNSCLELKHLARMMHSTKQIGDRVGLALLREDLSIIVDVVVNLRQLGRHFHVEDSRLFVFNATTVYYTSYGFVAPLRVHYNQTVPGALTSEFPSLLSVSMGSNMVRPCLGRPTEAKNWNYFTSNTDEIMVEVWPPGSSHQVRSANMTGNTHFCSDAPTISDNTTATPSFATVEEINYPVLLPEQRLFEVRDRGSACCVEMMHPETGEKLLTGVSHTKTAWSRTRAFPDDSLAANHFVSRFYAFAPDAPYRVVARSGFFCLGFATDAEVADLPLARYNRNLRKLWIGEEFTCPPIHFVSGITEKANDETKVILGYGVEDCTPRFVEIDKTEIRRLLFGPVFTIATEIH